MESPPMIDLVDCGLGNLNSISNMFRKIGAKVRVITEPHDVLNSARLVLPGVGAFDHGMYELDKGGWINFLNEAAHEKQIPILGVCLGMQLFCRGSEEGISPGLGWLDADVKRFCFPPSTKLKVPHMGWNTIRVCKSNKLIPEGDQEQRYYFVHSYHVACDYSEDILAIANHGYDIVAAVSKSNIYGVQFHPEKSHKFGMALLKRFIEL